MTRACYLLGISTSGFYDWRKSDKTHRYGVVHTDAFIVSTIKAFIEGRCKGYTPGLMVCYRHLRQQGVSVSVPRLRNLMRNAGIYHRFHRKYVKTTDSNHQLAVAPNLLSRQFDDLGINEAWCGDITYIRTREGWLYLASVIDLGTRRLVGYSMQSRMTSDLVMNAMKMAYENEMPDAGCIFHSDRGSQYCSLSFQAMLQEYGLRSSMSDLGQCWDNAPSESLWATLKREVTPPSGQFDTRKEAKTKIKDWISYYNGSRLHSKLGNKAPNVYYAELLRLI